MNYLALKLPGENTIDPPKNFKIKEFESLGAIVSSFLPYVLVLAGLVLLFLLITAGFQYLTSGGDPKSTQSAQQKMTSAVVGFVLLFVAYWLFQILGILMGLDFFRPGV